MVADVETNHLLRTVRFTLQPDDGLGPAENDHLLGAVEDWSAGRHETTIRWDGICLSFRAVSIDTGAVGMQRDVSLAEVLPEAERILQRLLGLPVRPSLRARYRVDQRADGLGWVRGAEVSASDRAGITLAGPYCSVDVAPDGYEHAGWTIWGQRPDRDESSQDFFIVFVTNKRAVGIVTSVAVALAVAILGDGSYWDSLYWHALLDLASQPAQIVEHCRLGKSTDLESGATAWESRFESA